MLFYSQNVHLGGGRRRRRRRKNLPSASPSPPSSWCSRSLSSRCCCAACCASEQCSTASWCLTRALRLGWLKNPSCNASMSTYRSRSSRHRPCPAPQAGWRSLSPCAACHRARRRARAAIFLFFLKKNTRTTPCILYILKYPETRIYG